MTLKIVLKLDNAAIVDGQREEVRRILSVMTHSLPIPLEPTDSVPNIGLYDYNGNKVGEAWIYEGEDE